jgi:tetratricopeptide (TPR) repeat protein
VDVTTSTDRAYPGARPFTRADDGRFFGRTAEAALLSQEWSRNHVTFLSGPAGIGKTSLLTAGVLPLVESSKVTLLPVGTLSGGLRCPVATLAKHNPYTLALLNSWSRDDAVKLASTTVDDFIRQYAQQLDPNVSILAAIDQADDLFAGPEARQLLRRRFLDELAAAVREQPALHLLVSVRSDVLPRVIEAIGDGVKFHLDPLTVEKAQEAVAGPGFFAPEAAAELVSSMRTSRIVTSSGTERLVITDQVEPALLQVACAWLWESLRERESRISKRRLEQYSAASVDEALTGYCSSAIAAVADIHGIPMAWLRSWLIDTFITEVGELETAVEGHPDTAGAPTTVARALEDRYLLRAHAGSRLYKLISDRLIEPLRNTTDDAKPTADPEEYLRAAERARSIGEHDLASNLARYVLDVAPDERLRLHAETQSLLGDLAYDEGHFDKAEDCYQTAAKLFEANGDRDAVARLLFAIARTYIDRNRLGDAVQLLVGAISRQPDVTVQVELSWAVEAMARQSPASPFRLSAD